MEGYGEVLPLSICDLVKIRRVLVGIYFIPSRFKRSCHHYWDYNLTQFRFGLGYIWNITRAIWRLRLSPNCMEVFFYDSY